MTVGRGTPLVREEEWVEGAAYKRRDGLPKCVARPQPQTAGVRSAAGFATPSLITEPLPREILKRSQNLLPLTGMAEG